MGSGKKILNAARNGHEVPLERLLATGADPSYTDEFGETALTMAIEVGSLECVIQLIDAGWDPNKSGKGETSPLHRAARKARFEIAERLLMAGGNPNSRDVEGMTPLHRVSESWADFHSINETIKVLLRYGADWRIKSLDGETAERKAFDRSPQLSSILTEVRLRAEEMEALKKEIGEAPEARKKRI